MSMIGFPLLLIPLAICNIVIFLMPGVQFAAPLFTLTLMSGVAWPVTLGDVLLALGIVLLLLEVIKGARPGAKYFTDHLLSLIVFGGAAAEFAMLPQFGSSIYFLLTLLALVDFLSGVALRTRRSARAVAVPSVAPVAESILKSGPEPVIVHPDAPTATAHPEVSAPGIQSGGGTSSDQPRR